VTNMTDVLAFSSPFLRSDRVEEFTENYSELLTRFNTPKYNYPLGEYKVCRHGSIDNLAQRIIEILEKPDLWIHSPPLLVVIDEQLRSQFESFFEADLNENHIKIVRSNQVEDIKGVDFQHVVIVLLENTFTALQAPFQGSGKAKFNNRRLLRIPFSRARDSLSLIVLDDNG